MLHWQWLRRTFERARHHLGKPALLPHDETQALRSLKVGAALYIGAQAGPVRLVSGQAVKGDQAPGLVVGAFARQEIAHEVAPQRGMMWPQFSA